MSLPGVRYIPKPLRTAHLAATYTTLDPRSLAAGRIALALALLIDLVNRWRQLPFWYTNLGLLPNHTLLWRPKFPFTLSFFYAASNQFEANVGFVICFLSYLALLFGYRTKLAQITSLFCVLSLHGRIILLQGGGDVVLGELALWTAFLPMGHRMSLDAVRRRLSGLGEANEAQGRIYRLAVLALILQLALIYLLNAAQKTGETWKAGTAVYYVLHQSRIVTRFGLWLSVDFAYPA
jgi:hypothetical protein